MKIYDYYRDKVKSKIDKAKYNKEKSDKVKLANMSKDENEIVNMINYFQTVAETPIQTLDLETTWKDNQKMYTGKHWDIDMISRTKDEKKHRFNMVKNHIRPTINNMRDNLCMSIPESKIDALEEEIPDNQEQQQQMIMTQPLIPGKTRKQLAEEITCMLKHNDNVDNHKSKYRRNSQFFLMHGPICIETVWDNDFIGGSGPERWQGDIRRNYIDKEDFFPDPSIIDLENDIQSCEFINIRFWKKLKYIENRFDKGCCVMHDFHEDQDKETGSDPSSAYLYKHYYRGKPYYMPKERKKELLEMSKQFENDGDYWRAKLYKQYANSEVDGIHICYVAGDVLLESIPYVYEHGMYPISFRTRFINEDNQRGNGEIEDLILPNMAINKAEESMLSAMAKQGLGNIFINENAMDTNQERSYIMNNGKGSAIHRVRDINEIREQGVNQIPPVFLNYVQSQEFFMEKSSSVTAISKGISPGKNTAVGVVEELGARTDIKTRSIAMILKELYEDSDKFRIKLMGQFYTEDRYYRIKGEGGKLKVGRLNRKDMMFTWDRQDEDGKTYKEWFIPEFDVNVRVLDEMPTEREYHTNTAMNMLQAGLITKPLVWETFDTGKLPSKDVAVKEVEKLDGAIAESKKAEMENETKLKQLEYEYKLKIEQMKLQQKQQESQIKQQEADRKDVEVAYNQSNEEKKLSLEQQKLLGELSKEDDPNKLLQFLENSFPDLFNLINDKRIPEQARKEMIQKIINTPENKLEELLIKTENMLQQIIEKGG